MILSEKSATFRDHALARILQAEGPGFIVIGEGFRIARPCHHRTQGVLRGFRDHVVFEFVEEPALGRRVIGAILQDPADMGGERHIGEQLALEQRSARFPILR
jgi:hypothetical protein